MNFKLCPSISLRLVVEEQKTVGLQSSFFQQALSLLTQPTFRSAPVLISKLPVENTGPGILVQVCTPRLKKMFQRKINVHVVRRDYLNHCTKRHNQITLHIVKDVVIEKLFPSIRPVIHPWMPSNREENPGKKKISPPLRMCHCLGKACLALVSCLLPLSAVCCYLTGHKQCKHQDYQQPGSRWIHVECGM